MLESGADTEVLADGTPARLGRYRLVRPISTGGMARVFEARRESLAGVAPRVAIKVILPDYAAHDGFKRLFINEARIGSLLTHQNLVQIQDFNCHAGRYYLVMEYVEGVTLRRVASLCRRHGVPVPLHIIAEIGRQVCDGLAYAHTARAESGEQLHLVHRDIKPSNLMINPQGVVKLLDFGISRAMVTAERAGAVRGTWGYMGPEQASGSEIGAAADLFGLGAVLYELAMLQPLFAEKQPEQILTLMKRDEAARRATSLTGPLSPLSSVLVRALQRDPAARFNSAAAMGRALSALIEDPVTSRDRLVRFQQDMVRFVSVGVVDVRRSGRSASTISPTAATSAGEGLPLAVGNAQGPVARVAAASLEVTPGLKRTSGRWRHIGSVIVTLAAVAVVVFTAWRLLQEQRAGSGPGPGVPASTGPMTRMLDHPPAPVAAPVAPSTVAPSTVAPSTVVSSPPEVPISAPRAPRETPRGTSSPKAATQAQAQAQAQPQDRPVVPVASSTGASAAGASAAGSSAAGSSAAGASAAAVLHVNISSAPRADVFIDGTARGKTPAVGLDLGAGRHSVRLQTPDGRRATFNIDVAADRRNTWVYDFESKAFR